MTKNYLDKVKDKLLSKHLKKEIRENYLKILGREPDEDGMNYYLEELLSKKISTIELPKILKNSREYNMRHPTDMDDNISIEKIMENDWNERAKSDINFAICSNENKSKKEFWDSGKSNCDDYILGKNTNRFEQILNHNDSKDMKILEIGCGNGRLLIHMSKIFGTIYGVDVSNYMIDQCSINIKEISNCKIQKNSGSDLSMFADNFFNFCYSYIVFQHIPEKNIINNYFQEVSRVLESGGIFRIQLNGMDEKIEINTWNGVHFTHDEIVSLASKNNFSILEESGTGTKYYWLTLKKQEDIKLTNELDYENEVKKLYEKHLHRQPDKTGLYYFTSKLKSKKLTISQVSKVLMESEEGRAFTNFSHYSDKYWNELDLVAKYKNKLSTGNEDIHWIDDIQNRFNDYLPFENILIVGCGNGWLERRLYDQGIGKNFDAFDISEKYIHEAKEKKENRNINYFIDDINNLQKIKSKKYDAIFNFAILHHATEIDSAMKKLSESLKPGGLIFNEEFVGPARNQYTDEHLGIMLEVNSDLPEKFRSKHTLRPPLANFRVEPSEAIHSDLVRSTFEKYFEIVFEREMNGGIAYQILWNNIELFKNPNDPEAKKWLNYLVEQDIKFSKQKEVPILFWYGVGQAKSNRKETEDVANEFNQKESIKNNKSSLGRKLELNNETNKLRFLNDVDVKQIDDAGYSFLNNSGIKLSDITYDEFLIFKEKLEIQNWMEVAFDMFYETNPNLYKIITDSNRSDFSFLLDIKKNDLALDVGAGWGQISVPLSKFCDVVALEGNLEKIDLITQIAKQENRNNIQYVATNIFDDIFKNEQFDFIILNDILELMDVIPKEMASFDIQEKIFQIAYNLLKPGGILYVGIENKYGLKYLLGEKDDHTGLEDFVYLNNNSIESFYKSVTGNYSPSLTQSKKNYEKILRISGFENIDFFASLPDFKLPKLILDLADNSSIQFAQNNLEFIPEFDGSTGHISKLNDKLQNLYSIFSANELSNLYPSYSIIARKLK
jgi:2-polyprenyl-3-methyl-5-hydroxy-6-metoxy-1,4-benzoquinol methylase